VIIPVKTLSEIVKLEPGPEGEVRIGVKDNHIFVKSGLRMLQSSLFEGTFPNYEKVMPEGNDRTVRCDTEAYLAALRRVSLLSAERTKAVKVSLGEGKMVISTQTQGCEAEIVRDRRIWGSAIRQVQPPHRGLLRSSVPRSQMELKDARGRPCARRRKASTTGSGHADEDLTRSCDW
jgi:hypothetical protein